LPDFPPVRWDGSAYNFRDPGGLPTEDGRTTRSGVLYRSATLHDLGPEAAAVLREELGIGCVVDLRTPDEVTVQGAATAGAWGVHCLSLPVVPPPLPERGGPADLLSRYFAYLERSTPNVVAALRHVSRTVPSPVAIHCTSGKDRTGVVTGLLLRLVGVTHDAVVEDYAATAANIGSVMRRLGRTADIPPGILQAEAETMRAFLEKFEARFGTVEAWALQHGLEAEEIGALRSALVQG
jgi:protein-tyrosine phosphatase